MFEINLDRPYLLSREEFLKFKEDFSSQGSGLFVYNKNSKNESINKINNLIKLEFGVHEFITNKALNGCKESLEKLEYGYDLYDELLIKAKELKLI